VRGIFKYLNNDKPLDIPEKYNRLKGIEDEMLDVKNRDLYPLVRITHQGVKEVEQAIHSPEKPTEHFKQYIPPDDK